MKGVTKLTSLRAGILVISAAMFDMYKSKLRMEVGVVLAVQNPLRLKVSVITRYCVLVHSKH